jgi:DNA-directed RNA polymerase I, II, and III subunit RPABC2
MDEEHFDEVSVDSDTDYDIDTPMHKHVNTESITSFMENYQENKTHYKTSNVLTKYEKARILSERAQQVEDGTPPYIVNFERFTSAYAIAVEELNQKKIPFIIRRSTPHSNHYEYWKLKDMIY